MAAVVCPEKCRTRSALFPARKMILFEHTDCRQYWQNRQNATRSKNC